MTATRPTAGLGAVTTRAAPRLEAIWADKPGIPGWLSTVDHKRIGVRYMVTSFVFLLLGGIEALLMRTQLATPNGELLSPETYNQLMTMHGTTMILLFNTPMFAAFGNYLVPLHIGTRDMAFPRLNMLGYWVFLLAGIFMYTSFLVGAVPDGGWFAYPPLTGAEYSQGAGLDFWAIGITFLGISTTTGAINFIVTILRMRAPGMSLNRMPLFVWGVLTMALMIVFALPAITLAGVLLELDRAFGMQFFVASGGGTAVLYQHLFWIWGHPEVYIVFIPATGIISMVVPVFSRRPIAGYPLVVAALVATGFISFGLWVHHMFAVGLPLVVASFFSAASMLVAIPSGVQVFAWLVTIARGRVKLEPPMLFAIGFIVIFVLGGITGVMVGVVPFDLQVHDSYFVVAHFHYVLIGGSVFPIFAGLQYWFPKVTGRLLDPRLGKTAFWLMFVGFHVTFFPHHILGFMGMPRRVYTYADGLGWSGLNLLSTVGAYMLATGVVVATADFLRARWRGPRSPENPWDADSLEWATSSPPPDYNFAGFPVVEGANPLWEVAPGRRLTEVTSLDGHDLVEPEEEHHEALLTSVLDADEVEVATMPAPSYWPLVVAIALLALSVAVITTSAIAAGCSVLVLVVAIARWQAELS